MCCPLWGYLLMLLILADTGRGNTDWFDCGTEHKHACKIFSLAKNWHDAEAACNTEFGHLASIVTITEDRDPIARKAAVHRQPCCRNACDISKRYDHYNIHSRYFETSRDLAELHLTDLWIGLNHLGGLQDRWRFTDGEVVNTDMWQTGYPQTSDIYSGLDQMCGVEYRNYNATVGFRNEHCDWRNQYVCKKLKRATQPIPPTTMKTPQGESYCPIGYTAIDPKNEPNMGEKCFKFVFLNNTNGVDWYEAVKRCRVPGRKSDIASVHGPYEHEFIRSQMVNRTFGLWIGLNDVPRWHWLDNSAFTREDANWYEDNSQEGPCVEVMSIPNAAKWNSIRCDQPRGYICQTYKDPDNPIIEPPPTPKQNCLEGYTPYPYGCYRLLSNTQKSWAEMRDECRSHSTGSIKSDLASIHSDAEDATLHIKVMQSQGRAWIGFKESQNNTFQWSNGWYPTYTNWGSIDGGDREYLGCVAMGNGTNGGWYEVNCSTPLAAICKTTNEEPTNTPSVKNGSCPGVWHGGTSWLKHGSYCYLPMRDHRQWSDARLQCARYGSSVTLVSIHSDDENKFVYDNMPRNNYWRGTGWIGLYRHTKDAGFHWTDRSSFQYEKWNLGEPNSNGNDDEDCVYMYTKGHDEYHWDDVACDEYHPFMCKAEQGPPMELPPEHPGTCPDGWHKFGAFCYLPFPETLTWWQAAEEYCQTEGGGRAHLPTITNKLQSDFIDEIMTATSGFHIYTPYWIGLIQSLGELKYHWVGTGEDYNPRGFHMFDNGFIQPHSTRSNCVKVRRNPYSKVDEWRKEDCELQAAYVCELPLDTDGLSPGEIAGIVIGVLIAVVLLSVIIVYVLDRRGVINFRLKMGDKKSLTGFSNENYEAGL